MRISNAITTHDDQAWWTQESLQKFGDIGPQPLWLPIHGRSTGRQGRLLATYRRCRDCLLRTDTAARPEMTVFDSDYQSWLRRGQCARLPASAI